MLAIPGNHDWYDGLTGFMRVFGQKRWIGGRQTGQHRSYFAVGLPHRHWLWGIDIQNDAYVDAAQIDYFQKAARFMESGDRLILCSAKPSWTDVDEPDAYRNLEFVERQLVAKDVDTVLMISGDKHHYAHYSNIDDEGRQRAKLTSGGGGAFLSATHRLSEHVDVPKSVLGEDDPPDALERFDLVEPTFPAAPGHADCRSAHSASDGATRRSCSSRPCSTCCCSPPTRRACVPTRGRSTTSPPTGTTGTCSPATSAARSRSCSC